MHKKKQARMRRVSGARTRIRITAEYRLCVNRTPRHIYAQVMLPNGSQTVVSASSLDKEIRKLGKMDKIGIATQVGALIAKRALDKKIKKVAFDRSGFFYHGRVKVLAEAARDSGLEI